MEKVVIQFTPIVQDYSRAMRAYMTRNKSYWVGLAIIPMSCVIFLVVSHLNIWSVESNTLLWINMLVGFLLVGISSPFWTGWAIARNRANNRLATLPTTCDIDNERLVVANSEAESKISWSVLAKAFEDKEYFLLTYSTNKNAIQFIPKRGFVSEEQEKLARSLITNHLGQIVDIQKGLTGWKLTLLSGLVFSLLMICVIVGSAALAILNS